MDKDIGIEVALLVASAYGKGINVMVWFAPPPEGIMPSNEFSSKLTSMGLAVGFEEDWETKKEIEIATSRQSMMIIQKICGVQSNLSNFSCIDVLYFLKLCDEKFKSYIKIIMGDQVVESEPQIECSAPPPKTSISPPVQRPKSAPPTQIRSERIIHIDIKPTSASLPLYTKEMNVQTSKQDDHSKTTGTRAIRDFQLQINTDIPEFDLETCLRTLLRKSAQFHFIEKKLGIISPRPNSASSGATNNNTNNNTTTTNTGNKTTSLVTSPNIQKRYIEISEIQTIFASLGLQLFSRQMNTFIHLLHEYSKRAQLSSNLTQESKKIISRNLLKEIIIKDDEYISILWLYSYIIYLHTNIEFTWTCHKRHNINEFKKALSGHWSSLSKDETNTVIESFEILSPEDLERAVSIRIDQWLLDTNGRHDFMHRLRRVEAGWKQREIEKERDCVVIMNGSDCSLSPSRPWQQMSVAERKSVISKLKSELIAEEKTSLLLAEQQCAEVSKTLFWSYMKECPRTRTCSSRTSFKAWLTSHFETATNNINIIRSRPQTNGLERQINEFKKALSGHWSSLSKDETNTVIESFEILSPEDLERAVSIRIDQWLLDTNGRHDFMHRLRRVEAGWKQREIERERDCVVIMNESDCSLSPSRPWQQMSVTERKSVLSKLKSEFIAEEKTSLLLAEQQCAEVSKTLFWSYMKECPRTRTCSSKTSFKAWLTSHFETATNNINIIRSRPQTNGFERQINEFKKALSGHWSSLSKDETDTVIESFEILSPEDLETAVSIRIKQWLLDTNGRHDFMHRLRRVEAGWVTKYKKEHEENPSKDSKYIPWKKMPVAKRKSVISKLKSELIAEEKTSLLLAEQQCAEVTKSLFWSYMKECPRTRLQRASGNFSDWLIDHLDKMLKNIEILKDERKRTLLEEKQELKRSKSLVPLVQLTDEIKSATETMTDMDLKTELNKQLATLRQKENIRHSCPTDKRGRCNCCTKSNLTCEFLISKKEFKKNFINVLAPKMSSIPDSLKNVVLQETKRYIKSPSEDQDQKELQVQRQQEKITNKDNTTDLFVASTKLAVKRAKEQRVKSKAAFREWTELHNNDQYKSILTGERRPIPVYIPVLHNTHWKNEWEGNRSVSTL